MALPKIKTVRSQWTCKKGHVTEASTYSIRIIRRTWEGLSSRGDFTCLTKGCRESSSDEDKGRMLSEYRAQIVEQVEAQGFDSKMFNL